MKEKIELVLATPEDAGLIHQMKYEAFLPLYEKYHDDETSPVNEKIDKVISQLTHPNSEYYLIQVNGENAGAVRAARKRRKLADVAGKVEGMNTVAEQGNNITEDMKVDKNVNFISPIFILPRFQNKGYGQVVINKLLALYPEVVTWKLDTIKQEAGNCHLYEKCGFVRIGEEKIVNDKMTLVDYEKTNVTARRFREEDATAVSRLICKNFIEVNSKDYGIGPMKKLAAQYNEEKVKNVASYAHMYVFEWHGEIVGVGAISSFWGSKTESILLTIFVEPALHGKGIGRAIIRTLESDELFTRADRIEIPASITGTEFYRKLGYDFKNGVKELDEERHYRLEKFRQV